MKKILTLLILLSFTFSAFAGHDDDNKTWKGVRAGYQSSNLFYDGDKLYDNNLHSFYVGVFGARKIGLKLFSIYSGLTFYQTGSDQSSDTRVVLSYIELPISLRVKLGPMYVFGGGNAAIKVGEKNELNGVDISKDTDIKSFDAGAQIGLGLKLTKIGVEIKYNWGLVDIADKLKTSHLQAGLCLYL